MSSPLKPPDESSSDAPPSAPRRPVVLFWIAMLLATLVATLAAGELVVRWLWERELPVRVGGEDFEMSDHQYYGTPRFHAALADELFALIEPWVDSRIRFGLLQ